MPLPTQHTTNTRDKRASISAGFQPAVPAHQAAADLSFGPHGHHERQHKHVRLLAKTVTSFNREGRVPPQDRPFGIYDGNLKQAQNFPQITSVFTCHYLSTNESA
jgi:hypothetical protein